LKAAVLRRFGAPPVLTVESMPDPKAEPGLAVIDVQYASVTFVETQLRAGRPPFAPPELPLIPGNGVGGTVREVGEGVDRALIGRSVVSTTGGHGGYAERVAVETSLLIPVPEAVTVRDAVALLADGRTALALVRVAELQEGETVLIEAAAGGVGTCLVQLARAAGANVIGAVGSARKIPVVEGLGAKAVVDYSRTDWVQRTRDEIGAVDVVFDGVGGTVGARALELVRPEGRFCQYGMASGSLAETPADVRDVKVLRGTAMSPAESYRLSAAALDLAAAGELAPVIGQEYPLDQIAAAHAAIEARATIGKTLLRVAESQT